MAQRVWHTFMAGRFRQEKMKYLLPAQDSFNRRESGGGSGTNRYVFRKHTIYEN